MTCLIQSFLTPSRHALQGSVTLEEKRTEGNLKKKEKRPKNNNNTLSEHLQHPL